MDDGIIEVIGLTTYQLPLLQAGMYLLFYVPKEHKSDVLITALVHFLWL